MQYSFKEFKDILDQSLQNVRFDKIPRFATQSTAAHDDLDYRFTIDNEEYRVSFDKEAIPGITDNSYEITLSGPRNIDLTGRGKGREVYRHLLLAVRKLIQEYKPDGLHFFGIVPEQNWMYNKFYERYLKKEFTMIDDSTYLSNKFIQNLKIRRDPIHKTIKTSMGNFNYDDYLKELETAKEEKRRNFMKVKDKVGQIVGIDSWPFIVYLTKMLQGKFEGITYDYSGRLTNIDVDPDQVNKIDNERSANTLISMLNQAYGPKNWQIWK